VREQNEEGCKGANKVRVHSGHRAIGGRST
jgi:hypothetical protein